VFYIIYDSMYVIFSSGYCSNLFTNRVKPVDFLNFHENQNSFTNLSIGGYDYKYTYS